MADFLPSDYVQTYLDQLKPREPFSVRFLKQNGEEREIVGSLDPQGQTRKQAVPVMTPEGWKSFLIHRVISIDRKGDNNGQV